MIYNILTAFVDIRKDGNDCIFNGYLEDYLHYLESHEETLPVFFQKVLEILPDARICAGLNICINKDVVSNQIIGYKDAFKLEGKPLVCPYLLYLQKDNEERLIILTGDTESSYLYAKSLYFCFTEPTGLFEPYKNSIITMDTRDGDRVVKVVKEAFDKRAGVIQREIDQESCSSFEVLKEMAMVEAHRIRETAFERIRPLEDKAEEIKNTVVSWFLLKKLVYVQYMVNKSVLQSRYDGDVKKQRAQAREHSKAIPFVAFSELWRCGGENLPNENKDTQD